MKVAINLENMKDMAKQAVHEIRLNYAQNSPVEKSILHHSIAQGVLGMIPPDLIPVPLFGVIIYVANMLHMQYRIGKLTGGKFHKNDVLHLLLRADVIAMLVAGLGTGILNHALGINVMSRILLTAFTAAVVYACGVVCWKMHEQYKSAPPAPCASDMETIDVIAEHQMPEDEAWRTDREEASCTAGSLEHDSRENKTGYSIDESQGHQYGCCN